MFHRDFGSGGVFTFTDDLLYLGMTCVLKVNDNGTDYVEVFATTTECILLTLWHTALQYDRSHTLRRHAHEKRPGPCHPTFPLKQFIKQCPPKCLQFS